MVTDILLLTYCQADFRLPVTPDIKATPQTTHLTEANTFVCVLEDISLNKRLPGEIYHKYRCLSVRIDPFSEK